MVRPSGLEPPTPTMSRWCSNHLSYGRTICSGTSQKAGAYDLRMGNEWVEHDASLAQLVRAPP